MNKIYFTILLFIVFVGIFSQNTNQNNNENTVDNKDSQNGQEISGTTFQQYQDYIHRFQKNFKSLDELRRHFEAYQKNQEKIKHLNELAKNDDGEEMFGETEFSDFDEEEFENTFLNFKASDEELEKAKHGNGEEDDDPTLNPIPSTSPNGRNLQSTDSVAAPEIPVNWDWRAKGAVGPVKNQGSCGGCWAFTAVANIEGLHFIKYGVLLNFAEQNLLDCSLRNNGCYGGWMERAFSYIKNAGGLQLTKDYGSFQFEKKKCTFKLEKAATKVKSWVFPGSNEKKIRDYLFKNGPLAAAIDAKNLQYYRSGITSHTKTKCSNKVNHAVTLVGYGTSNGTDYWIVKNSWGARWGEKGYFRITRGEGSCGINTYIVSAVLA